MKKILVTIYVLGLNEEFDVFIPINLNLGEALDLIQNSIVELTDYNFQKLDNPRLYTENGAKIANLENLVKYSGLTNGCKVLLK